MTKECNELLLEVKKNLTAKGRKIVSIEVKKFAKNNSVITGLLIREKESFLSPIIYIDKELLYLKICPTSVSEIANEICDTYLSAINAKIAHPSEYLNKEYLMEHTVLYAVGLDNELYLSDKIYKTVCDIAFVPKILTPDILGGEAPASIAASKELLKVINVSEDELFSYASCSNTIDFYKVFNSIDIVHRYLMKNGFECLGELGNVFVLYPDLFIPMYAITDKDFMFGASVLAYPDILAKLIEEDIGFEDVVVLPSSVHEIIVIPEEENRCNMLKELVKRINREYISPEERLTNSIYSFNTKEKILRII